MKLRAKKLIILIVLICIIGTTFGIFYYSNSNKKHISYKEFNTKVENNEIVSAEITEDKLNFKLKDDENLYYTDNPKYDGLKEKLLLNEITVTESNLENTTTLILDWILTLVFLGMIGTVGYIYFKKTGNMFKVVRHTKVKFDDIAGMNELKKEMMVLVDVLKNSDKYSKKGIRHVKGVILEGTPGNGKTFFAKALAEEAGVKFISAKGADFQSAMMSMGSQKIKALFRKARRNRPCIIFIDEFDSIGERRNYAGSGVDKENNRIITSMLNEMDGFDTQDGILVIAATNSYNSLDPALIRPGRFDLKYTVQNPDLQTRRELIEIYTKNKKVSEDVNKDKLAEEFKNLSCSAIETIINEASMLAIIEKHDTITPEDIKKAERKVKR